MLLQQLGIKLGKLVKQNLILPLDVVGVTRHHKQQQGITFDVTQETKSQPLALTGTLNDTGNVSHHKRLIVTIPYNTQAGLHRGEGIIGYLRTRIRQGRHQRRLTRIGKAHQSDISQEFQLQNNRHLLHRLTRLRITWSLIRGSTKLEVTQSATTAFQQYDFLPVVGDVTDVLSRLGIIDDRTARHIDIHVLAVRSMTLVTTAITTMLRKDMALIAQVKQRPVVMVTAQDDASPLATVATVRTSVWIILHMTEMHRSPSALARTA